MEEVFSLTNKYSYLLLKNNKIGLEGFVHADSFLQPEKQGSLYSVILLYNIYNI